MEYIPIGVAVAVLSGATGVLSTWALADLDFTVCGNSPDGPPGSAGDTEKCLLFFVRGGG